MLGNRHNYLLPSMPNDGLGVPRELQRSGQGIRDSSCCFDCRLHIPASLVGLLAR